MSWFDSFLSVIYPKRCPCCGELNVTGEPCERCSENLEELRLKEPCCLKCGDEKMNCKCSGFNPLYNGVISVFKNKGAAQSGIYGLKFNSRFYAAEYFGLEMAKTFSKRCAAVKPDVVCVVPMTAKERNSQPCDQVHLLAKCIVKELKLPYDPKLIKKIRETKRQHTLSHRERAANVKGAFAVRNKLYGKIVLLIDDIKTSGYTLNECAKQLRLNGAAQVWCLTALYTSKGSCNNDGK